MQRREWRRVLPQQPLPSSWLWTCRRGGTGEGSSVEAHVCAVWNGNGVSNAIVSAVSNASNVSALDLDESDESVVFTSVCMVRGVSVCLSVCLSVCTAWPHYCGCPDVSRRHPVVGVRNERGGSAGPGSPCARFTCSPALSHPPDGCSSGVCSLLIWRMLCSSRRWV